MTERYRFFDSVVGDERVYNASEFASYFNRIVKNGLYNEGDKLAVTADGATLKTKVGTGVYFFDGRMYENDATLEFTHDAADPTLSRIDRIVLRLDLNSANRYIKLFVKKGTAAASPTAPSLTSTSLVKEVAIATVRINPARTYLQQADITDQRPANLIEPIVNDVYSKSEVYTKAEADSMAQTKVNATQVWKLTQDNGRVISLVDADLNTIYNGGVYYAGSSSLVNAPVQVIGILEVYTFGATTALQRYTTMQSSAVRTFERYASNGAWGAWIEFENTQGTDSKITTAINNAQAYKLTNNDGVTISYNGNTDTLTQPGFYYLTGTATNKPANLSGFLEVHRLLSSNGYFQIFRSSTRHYHRYYDSGSWGNWIQFETTDGAQAKVDTHAADNVKHITSTERTNWNAKETTSGAQSKANAIKTYVQGRPQVFARSTVTQAINASTMTKVIFNSIITGSSQNYGDFNVGTGVFTVSEAGVYLVSTIPKTDTINQYYAVETYLYKNNSQHIQFAKYVAPGQTTSLPGGSIALYCAAGTTLDVRIYSSQAFNMIADSTISITQIS